MLKKFLIGTFVAVAFMMSASFALAAYDFGPTTLKVGSSGDYVKTLQTFIGANADGAFGPMTKAKVMAWQATNGLTADGLFGNMSKAKANEAQSNFPAGCTNASGFSTINGVSCASVNANTFSPSGCTSASGFSPVTGGACVAVNANTFPAGCTTASGFSPTTGASCAGGAVINGPLTGGEGTLTLTDTSKDVEDNAVESKDDVKIFGFKAEADGSDISLSSLKLTFANTNYIGVGDTDPSSEKLSDYVDSVTVFMGSTEVGSADVSDFTKKSDTPDEYSKSISLTNAVIQDGKTATFYVAVSSGSVDSDDLDAQWEVTVTGGRYVDATGAIMAPEDTLDGATFGYNSASEDDVLSIKTSTASPAATTIKVDADNSTDDKLIGAFKFDVGADSSDITINEFTVNLAVTATTASNIEDVIDEVYVTIDGGSPIYGEKADYSGSAEFDVASPFTEAYTFDLSDEDVVIAGDDQAEVKIYASFAKQSGNYGTGTTVVASVDDSSIDAEGAETLTSTELSGQFNGKVQTLSVAGITLAKTGTATAKYSLSDDNTQAQYVLKVKVTNDGDDAVYIPFGALQAASLGAAGSQDEGLAFVLEDASGNIFDAGSNASVSVEALDDNADIEEDYSFFIEANSSEILTVTVTLNNTGTAGTYRMAIKDAQYVDGDSDGTDTETTATKVSQSYTNVRTGVFYVGTGV